MKTTTHKAGADNKILEKHRALSFKKISSVCSLNRLAECLELTDKDFVNMIFNIESDPLFRRLCYNPYPEDTIVTMKRFEGADISLDFYRWVKPPFKRSFIDLVGETQFKHFFIYHDSPLTPEQIAANCGISLHETVAVRDHLSLAYVPSGTIAEIISQSSVTYTGEEHEKMMINFYSPIMARGIYIIDYQRLSAIREMLHAQFDKEHIRKVIRALELINLRKTIVYNILQQMFAFQQQFIKTGDVFKKVILNQKTIAQELCIDKSIVSRAIHNRSIIVQGTKIFLKDLCLNKKKIILQLMKKITEDERTISSDEELRKKIKSRYRIRVSRRSIATYRKQLTIPSSFTRVKS
ncbi:MAG: hypothetical protein ABII23_00295 [bacterium]